MVNEHLYVRCEEPTFAQLTVTRSLNARIVGMTNAGNLLVITNADGKARVITQEGFWRWPVESENLSATPVILPEMPDEAR